MSKTEKIILGIASAASNGDFFIRLLLKSFEDKRMLEFCTPVVFASNNAILAFKKKTSINTPHYTVSDFNQIKSNKLNIFDLVEKKATVEDEAIAEGCNQFSSESLEKANKALKDDYIDGLISFPFNKNDSDNAFLTSDEELNYFLRKFSQSCLQVLANEDSMIAIANKKYRNTVSEISAKESFLSDIEIIKKLLKEEFTLSKPKIAIAANASDEFKTIKSVVEQLQLQHQLIYGPFETKDLFDSGKNQAFDTTLLILEDQEKSNDELFNSYHFKYLAGLDKVVIVPNFLISHDSQKSEILNIASFHEAYFFALKIVRNRKIFEELTKNPLKIQSKKFIHKDRK